MLNFALKLSFFLFPTPESKETEKAFIQACTDSKVFICYLIVAKF